MFLGYTPLSDVICIIPSEIRTINLKFKKNLLKFEKFIRNSIFFFNKVRKLHLEFENFRLILEIRTIWIEIMCYAFV